MSITKVEKTLNIFLNGRTKFKRSQNLSFLYTTFPLESQTETFRTGLYINPQINRNIFFFILQRQYNSSTIFSNYFCLKARRHLWEKTSHNKQELVPCCFFVLKTQTGHAMLMLKIFPYVRDIYTSTAVLPVQKGPEIIIPEYQTPSP